MYRVLKQCAKDSASAFAIVTFAELTKYAFGLFRPATPSGLKNFTPPAAEPKNAPPIAPKAP